MSHVTSIGSTGLRAVIYCRVSSVRQTKDGSGLATQEQRCREYADSVGLDVTKVFRDDMTGSGDFMKRPGMRELLSFVGRSSKCKYVVIFDDLKRFARDTVHHLTLRDTLMSHGAMVKCLNHTFDDSPEGRFLETILAAQGQLEREQLGRQTNQKMRARLMGGYWVFKAAIGYKYVRDQKGGGKVLVRDEPLASIMQTALKGYASGRFATPADVKCFLESEPEFPKDLKGESVRFETVDRLLRRVLYSGHLEHKEWGISLRKGHHPALITLDEFEMIQQKLDGKKRGFTRIDEHPDFPLRGLVACNDCEQPMTGSWSRGSTKRFAYYRCQTKGCVRSGKSIRAELVEADMANLLMQISPSPETLSVANAMLSDVVANQENEVERTKKATEKRLREIDQAVDALVDRIAATKEPRLIDTYESRVLDLERKRTILTDKLQTLVGREQSQSESIELALTLLSNPCKIYKKGDHRVRRLVAKLAFERPVPYSKESGYRTPDLSFPFKALEDFKLGKNKLVPPHGLEPRTY
ncbi:recombinase family protein [Tropicibacter alexandrii]|uniref:recombinase family protein n=1 Tax=Tropicibacter alexandrii TaxID=2267683 RepID=UPI003B83115C